RAGGRRRRRPRLPGAPRPAAPRDRGAREPRHRRQRVRLGALRAAARPRGALLAAPLAAGAGFRGPGTCEVAGDAQIGETEKDLVRVRATNGAKTKEATFTLTVVAGP